MADGCRSGHLMGPFAPLYQPGGHQHVAVQSQAPTLAARALPLEWLFLGSGLLGGLGAHRRPTPLARHPELVSHSSSAVGGQHRLSLVNLRSWASAPPPQPAARQRTVKLAHSRHTITVPRPDAMPRVLLAGCSSARPNELPAV